MRNPNGYGSVVKLSGNRRRPYAVRKVKGYNAKGHPIYEVIGYTTTREEGNILLAEYNKEPWDIELSKITLAEIYNKYMSSAQCKRLSTSCTNLYASCYRRHLSSMADAAFRSIKSAVVQEVIDRIASPNIQTVTKALWGRLESQAQLMGLNISPFGGLLQTAESIALRERVCFTHSEIAQVWDLYNQYITGKIESGGTYLCYLDVVLILLYTGMRATELLDLPCSSVDTDKWVLTGGNKTAAGRNRIIPIHTKIRPLITARLADGGEYLINIPDSAQPNGLRKSDYQAHRRRWGVLMSYMGMSHTSHECRHTLHTELDKVGANRVCMDRIFGHSSNNIGDRVYTHKDIADLHDTIALVTY